MNTLKEEIFEQWVENQINLIDKNYMSDKITTEEYESLMKELHKVEEKYYSLLCQS